MDLEKIRAFLASKSVAQDAIDEVCALVEKIAPETAGVIEALKKDAAAVKAALLDAEAKLAKAYADLSAAATAKTAPTPPQA